jgi:riboflavin biosynthesis pyrimidine reductase
MAGDLPIEPLQVLYEAERLLPSNVPTLLRELYDGGLAIEEPCLYANFVSSIDGVVAVPSVARSNAVIAGGSDGDRFVMGLLRAFADCVVIGAGTLAASPQGTWLAERVFPAAADAFAELRRLRGRPAKPEIAVVSGHGSIDPAHPVLAAGAVVLTSDEGAGQLEGRLPAEATLVALGDDTRLDPASIVEALHGRGHPLVLSEAGPHTFGGFVSAGLADELFLTISPLVAGRGDERSLGFVESAGLFPGGVGTQLLSLRRHGQHLFLRYAFEHTTTEEST